MCFAPALALAKKLMRSGADALVIEGMEAGGHIGPVSTSVLAQEILPNRQQGHSGIRRRRDRTRRGNCRLSGNGRRGRAARHALRLRAECIAHPNFKKAFIRASARDAIPSVQIDPRLPVIPVRALKNQEMEQLCRQAAGSRNSSMRARSKWPKHSCRSNNIGQARSAAR